MPEFLRGYPWWVYVLGSIGLAFWLIWLFEGR